MGCRSLAYTMVVGAVVSSTLRAQASPSNTCLRSSYTIRTW